MLKWYLSFFLLMSLCIYPQWKTGAELNLGYAMKELDYQFGAGFNLEYSLKDIPFAAQLNARYSTGLSIFTFTTRTLGTTLLYFPFENTTYTVKPFLSAGFLYNWYNTGDQNGMNPERLVKYLENSTSTEFSIGFNLNPSSRNTNYIFEFTYSHNKPWYQYKLGPRYFLTDTGLTYRDQFNYSVLMFRFGVLFRS